MKFDDYSRTFLHFHDQAAPELLTRYLPTGNFSVADLGAGDGVILVALQRGGWLSRAKSIVAVDISRERCDRLNQCSDIRVICSDVTNIPELEDACFDYVISTQVIEHVEESELLSEITRILRPKGVLYIASLVNEKANDRHYMLKYGWRYGWRFYKKASGKWFVDPTHLREYESKQAFVEVLSKAGFDVQEAMLTPLKLSLLEFLVRRIVVPIFNPRNPNDFFSRHAALDVLRRNIKLQPPGYYLVEAIATKQSA
jgi:ubiquinone/menaquinone biosynthesis C-methylase UbiE